MPDNNSPLATGDVREVLMQALESEKGLQLTFATPTAAITFRRRAYAFRDVDRKRSKDIYEKGHPMFGVSDFDGLRITLDGRVIKIEKYNLEGLQAEIKQL
jgi:hypothetical protein